MTRQIVTAMVALPGAHRGRRESSRQSGLGCSLVALSDIVFMAESAHLADPHVARWAWWPPMVAR